MSLYDQNLAALAKRWPKMAGMVANWQEKDRVSIAKARDGGVAYFLRGNNGLVPLTDPESPTRRTQVQLDSLSRHLLNFTRPVMVVGFRPGNECLYLFDQSENSNGPHCPQPLWICVDSIECLYAFMNTWDARRIFESERVSLFWHEAIDEQIGFLRDHPEFPHLFTLVSNADNSVLDRVMPPFTALIEEREAEMQRLIAENEAYYDSLDDAHLAGIIAGRAGRKPRLLMPTCSWSTFIQHSTRDTCAAFDAMGWETRILKMDAMLTNWLLVRQINEFKPDIFLMISHLRREEESIYPRNMMFMTWVQDEMPGIMSRESGDKLRQYATARKRDLILGYTTGLAERYGYPSERLVPATIPANPDIFHPVSISRKTAEQYACELAFMSNVSRPTEVIARESITPSAAAVGIPQETVTAIHDFLWAEYRAGHTFIEREPFVAALLKFGDFARAWNASKEEQDNLFLMFFRRLNDAIYRHVVIEWADELEIDLRLYGDGWERHPRFGKYARGPLAHGQELSLAYQAARINLHLNATPGMHQRLWEIAASGGLPLTRAQNRPTDSGFNVKRNDCMAIDRFTKWCIALPAMANMDKGDPASRAAFDLHRRITTDPLILMPLGGLLQFHDKASFTHRMETLLKNDLLRSAARRQFARIGKLTSYEVVPSKIIGAITGILSTNTTGQAEAQDNRAGESLRKLAGQTVPTAGIGLILGETCLQTGWTVDARRILHTIRPEEISPVDSVRLAIALLQAGLFRQSLDVFASLPEPYASDFNTNIHKALLFSCLRQDDKAWELLDRTRECADNVRLFHTCVEGDIARQIGNRDRISMIIPKLEEGADSDALFSTWAASSLAVLHRRLGDMDAAVQFNRRSLVEGNAVRHWTFHFEYASTLRGMERHDEAFAAARIGAESFTEPCNACGILAEVVRAETTQGAVCPSPARCAEKAAMNIYPWFPHKSWLSLLAIAGSGTERAGAMLRKSLAEEIFLDPSRKTILAQAIETGDTSGLPALMAAEVYPFHEHDSIDRTCLEKDISTSLLYSRAEAKNRREKGKS